MNGNYQQPHPNNGAPRPPKPPFYKNWVFWLVIGVSAAVMTLLILLFVLVSQWLSVLETGMEIAGEQISQNRDVLDRVQDELEKNGVTEEAVQDILKDKDSNEILSDIADVYEDGKIDQQEIQDLLDKYDVEIEE